MMSAISPQRLVLAGIAIALYALLCAAIAYRLWRRRQQAVRDAAALSSAPVGVMSWLIVYASQTGNAEQLAWHTARMLHTAGVPARVMSLAQLQASELSSNERALFIASTYGEGDAPDSAALFARKLMSATLPLQHLHYGVLALGDRTYRHFCGFGRVLDQWLQAQGAQPLFERIDVDNNNAAALNQWQHHLSHVAGTSDLPDWQAPAYEPWRLAARELLNPGSSGGPCFHIELEPASGGALPHWQAGDLVQVQPPADPQRPREYSIASIPADGRVHLLVRQERHSDGSLGIASGWLTEHAVLGEPIHLRLRSHSNFHLADNTHRPLILIGNGTGLAGLRSHLKARAAVGQHRNWLIFGERTAAHDSYHRHELEAWRQQGVLQHIDLVFSRDPPSPVGDSKATRGDAPSGIAGLHVTKRLQSQREYVQDRLRTRADEVRAWFNDGAAIYVCGSLEGMAGGVEAALIDIIGSQAVEQLIESGRYRRDVY